MRTKEKGKILKKTKHPVVTLVSIIGLVISAAPVFMGLPSVDAAVMLVIVPSVCCIGLLMTNRVVFSVFYVAVFLLARLPMLLSGAATFLTVLFCLIVVFLFVWAAVEAYHQ